MPAETNEQVAQVLGTLGLTTTELRSYDYLLKVGAASPTMVARETGQSRGRIYETLRLLVQKGLAREEPTRPIKYVPVPFAEVVTVALAETNRRAQLLRNVYASVNEAPPGAEPAFKAPATRPQDLSVVSGRRAIQAEMHRMVNQATSFFYLMGGGQLASRLAASPELLRDLREAAGRGVRVEIHLRPSVGTNAALQSIRSELGSAAIRELPPVGNHPLVYAVSESAALSTVVQPDDASPHRGEDVAVKAKSAPLVAAVLDQFAPYMGWPRGADAPASPHPGEIPKLADAQSQDILLQYLRAIDGAKNEVLGMGPKGWSQFLEEGWKSILGSYAGALRRGVKFRAVTEDSEGERSLLEPFQAVWEIRISPWVPVWLIVIDGKEIFQAYAADSRGPARFRYSRDPQDVRFYMDLFERLWADSKPLARSEMARSEKSAEEPIRQ